VPAATPVTVNVPVVLPPEMFTLAGEVINPPGLADSETLVPASGAGALRVMVPLTVFETPTLFAVSETVIAGITTFTVAEPGWSPAADAKTVVLPAPTGVTVTVTLMAFGGIVTLGGTVATVGSREVRLIAWPLAPAGDPIVTVRVPATLNRFNGFGVSEMPVAVAVIVTVAGLLFVKPSFTTNWTTYDPATSATNVGETEVGKSSVAVLPAGRLSRDQE
jgi:hypothetical protein